MLLRIVSLVSLFAVVAARPALAEPADEHTAAPLFAPGPQPGDTPPPEIGLGAAQFVLGSLATFASGVGVLWIGAEAKTSTFILLGAGAAPGFGSWAICGIGRSSDSYDGGCGQTIAGGYLGAILLAIPMAYVGAEAFAPSDGDGGVDHTFGAAFGVTAGIVVGTAIGATIGWHLSKHRRARPVQPGALPAPPMRASLDPAAEVRARTFASPAGVAIGLPLVSLRF